MACFESETRDKVKIAPEVTKAFWREAKGQLDAGHSYDAVIKGISEKAGISEYLVARAISEPKSVGKVTAQMWQKQARHRALLSSARQIVRDADKPGWQKIGNKLWDSTRASLTLGHGGVFPFTHMRDSAMLRGESDIFRATVKRAYSYATKTAGEARWARDMDLMQRRESYIPAVRAGLDFKPGSEPAGILTNGAKGWSRRSFDALKQARLDLWERATRTLGEDVRPEVLKALAQQINHATGSVTIPSQTAMNVLGKLMFAPKLKLAKYMSATVDPFRPLLKGGRMTPAERFASQWALRRWAKVAGIQSSLVAANAAFNSLVLHKNNVNVTDPTKSDFMRMKIGNFVLPVSPLFETLKVPVRLIASAMSGTKRQSGTERAMGVVNKELQGDFHPTIHLIEEALTGREPFYPNRRVAIPGVQQLLHGEQKEKQPRMSALEYAASKGPIPISGAVKEFYQALRDEGMKASDSMKYLRGLTMAGVGAVTSGALGMHGYEESDSKQKQRATAENAKFRWF